MIANIITGFRILGRIILLFFPALSTEFYVTYLLCGFSDMIDGTVARKTNSVSPLGSELDTAADLVFVTVSLVKLLPVLHIPKSLWTGIALIGIIKTGNIIRCCAHRKTFLSRHTVMNKITGLLLFLLPFTVSFIEVKYSSAAVCFIAAFAAIQEGFHIGD